MADIPVEYVDSKAYESTYVLESQPFTNFYNVSPILTCETAGYLDSTVCYIRIKIPEEVQKKHVINWNFFVYVMNAAQGELRSLQGDGGRIVYPEDHLPLNEITYFNTGSASLGGLEMIRENLNGSIGWLDMLNTWGDEDRKKTFVENRLIYLHNGSGGCVQISGVSTANAPYIRFYIEDPEFAITGISPNSGFILRKNEAIFTFTPQTNARGGMSAFSVTNKFLEWKAGEEGTVQTVQDSSSGYSITVPADTFPSSTIQVRIGASFDNFATVYSSWYTLTTVDSIPTTTILSPKSVYIDGSVPNTFSWSHNITTGTPQSKYELEYSVNDGSSWEQVSAETTSQTSVTFPPDTFPSGSMMWRVRTANQDEIFGEWSDPATVIVRAAPDPPIISPVGSEPMPTIRWQADDQQATEIRIDSVLVATLYGSGKAYTPETFLSDGEHTVSIRVQNRFGLWSEWALASFHTENLSSDTVELSAQSVENGVGLLWTGPSATYWIERDGEKIAEVNGGDFVDYTAIGEHSYRVRAVLDGGYYALSNEVSAVSSVQYAVISRVDPIAFIALEKRRNAFPTHTETIESLSTFNHYSGRSLPVAEISLHKTIRHQFDFTFKVPKESYVLDALLGETVLYKDCNGACFVGVLSAIDRTTDRASDITLTIMETGG